MCTASGSGRLVRNPDNASSDVSRRPSSRSRPATGTIWPSNRPSAQAVAARSWERLPNTSVSKRLIPQVWAIRSAPWNCVVASYRSA